MTNAALGKKLDLSKLTDEEAKHVWEVIQRDFDLRKKEEDRLGELKNRIEKEDTKRELLGSQTRLTDSHCIRCLQPFKFLVNSKRQCLDCQLYVCKTCSRYNKKEHGWVCDPCRMARVLKIGTLEWYHENVRSRFKRFGSAKVMRSLYKRLNGEHGSQSDLRGPSDDTRSLPDVQSIYYGHEEDGLDTSRYKSGRKTKRLLPVHPLDFDLDSEIAAYSSRPSFHVPAKVSGSADSSLQTKSMTTEAAIFQKMLEEQGGKEKDMMYKINRRKSLEKSTRSDEGGYQQRRMTRTRSLSKISSSNGPQHLLYNEADTSDDGESSSHAVPQPISRRHSRASFQETVDHTTPPQFSRRHSRASFQETTDHTTPSQFSRRHSRASFQETTDHTTPPQFSRRHSRASFQETMDHTTPPINELNKRMSAIESLLNHLEQKMTVPPEQSEPPTVSQLEEEKLRKKLGELVNISDKGMSSEEDEAKRQPASSEAPLRSAAYGMVTCVSPLPLEGLLTSSGEEVPSEAQKRSTAAALCDITTEVLRTLNATENALTQFTPPKPKVSYPLMGRDVTQADEAYRDLEENVYITTGKSYDLEKKLQELEEIARSHYCGTTDSELSELEDKVAQAAAKVHSTESEVSDIENKIAALSAVGMTGDKAKRRASGTHHRRRLSHDFPMSTIKQ